MIITCPQCGMKANKAAGTVNRSRAKGAPVYCGRVCFGLARRDERTAQQRKDDKADYDQRRRAALGESLLVAKREAYRTAVQTAPEKLRAQQKRHREQRREQHLEYCRTPEYRAWKRAYDRRHRAVKDYGPFADAALTLLELQEEIDSRSTWLERAAVKGTLNKAINRKREYGRSSIQETVRREPKGRVVGYSTIDPERPASASRG